MSQFDVPWVLVEVHGRTRRVCSCTCETCDNTFLIFYGPEFFPKLCPYCGIGFDQHEYSIDPPPGGIT